MTDIQSRTEEIRGALLEAGACLVGFADLSCLRTVDFVNRSGASVARGYSFGIGFALEYALDAVDSLPQEKLFRSMKARVDENAKEVYAIAVELLDNWGYRHTRISSSIPSFKLPNFSEELPQKTIATLAGLGWIGKSTLLVSVAYGPRLRLGALLTDEPFQTDTPVVHSSCNDCNLCVDACQVGAIKGANWSQSVGRAELLEVDLCCDCFRLMSKLRTGNKRDVFRG
jgi:epoxyqueuosine reductase QueG